MLNLTVLLFERAGLIIILAFFLVNIPQFRKLLFRKDWSTTFQLFAIFSIFTIVANLIGVELRPDNSIQFKSLLQNVTPGDSVANIRIFNGYRFRNYWRAAGWVWGRLSRWTSPNVARVANNRRPFLYSQFDDNWNFSRFFC